MDSFKESMDAFTACAAVAEGIRQACPSWRIIVRPIADGGEGTARVLLQSLGGEWRRCRVNGPLPGQTVEAGFAWIPSRQIAVVEMAAAAGLTLVPQHHRNPERTTTLGVGQLLRAAGRLQPRRILLTIGGSATVDGGVGMAMALGWRFLDTHGHPIGLGGGALSRLRTIHPPARFAMPPVDVLCDVTNPLLGPNGAAAVYGPQKGATPSMVLRLEHGLANLAQRMEQDLGFSGKNLAGAGAAGGLGGGAVAFLQARIRPGTETILKLIGLPAILRGAAWVITGEGTFDATSLQGKAVSGILAVARRFSVRVAVLAGQIRLSSKEWLRAGVDYAVAIGRNRTPTAVDLQRAPMLLRSAAARWAHQAAVGRL